jgi:starch synthase (maltosyl-transferring)
MPVGDSVGRRRVVVEAVTPAPPEPNEPVRRAAGDRVVVEADVYTDGTDRAVAELLVRRPPARSHRHFPLRPLGNDRFRGEFPVPEPGAYRFTVRGWVDPLATWRAEAAARAGGGALFASELQAGAELLRAEGRRRHDDHGALQRAAAREIAERSVGDVEGAIAFALDPSRTALFEHRPPRDEVTVRLPEIGVWVDPARARASAWYELFPRSTSPDPERPGRFSDVFPWLSRIADLGFDVLYLPPIHPIGRTHRKGPGNALTAGPGDPGSPWAIGDSEGGHTSIDPGLGTLEEFRELLRRARDHGLEVALDLAFQCSPDHPWVREHPEWFRHRPDGSIRSAENPPKRYEDIYPLDLTGRAARALWEELYRVAEFWIAQGVTRFRVDNPHTKPFAFWDWFFDRMRREHPEVLFLSEAFTRPKVMYRLARAGFSHSYTYFAWRSTRRELVDYFEEIARPPVSEFFRPHLWPNTPDILTGELQTGGPAAFRARFVLAATLSSNYGIYGPLFEQGEPLAVPGSEEYYRSEKYEIRHWRPGPFPLDDLVRRVNAARRSEAALTLERNLDFHPVDNEQLLAYSRTTPDGSNTVLVVVNLDPRRVQSGWTELKLDRLGLAAEERFAAHDLLTDRTFPWRGARNFVELRPAEAPAHLLRIERSPGKEAGRGG